MPIKPENKTRYPVNWRFIRVGILWRADQRCEGSPAYPDCRAKNYEPHPDTGSRVILTIAHMDHTPENCDGLDDLPCVPFDVAMLALIPDIEKSNLRAWCQRCHLNFDAKFHRNNAALTRMLLAEIGSLADIADHGRRKWTLKAARPCIVSNMTAACEGFLRAVDRGACG